MTEHKTCPFCGAAVADEQSRGQHANDCYFTLHKRLQQSPCDRELHREVIRAWDRRADATCALRGAQKESGWQSIDSAPKDGTPILAWNAEYGARETRSITYTPGSPGFAEGLTDRWWQWDEPKNNWSLKWQPTHWMPIPSPPTPEGEAK